MKKLWLGSLSLFLCGCFLVGGSSTGEEIQLSADKQLTQKLKTYRQTVGKKSRLKKSFYQAFKGTTDESEGQIFLFQKRLKIEIQKPKESQSLLVVNWKSLWLETPMGDGFPVAVTRLPLQNLKRTEGIWSVLIGEGSFSSSFLVTKKENAFELVPRDKGNYDLSKVKIEFKGEVLTHLSYWDQLENRVSYDFLKWESTRLSLKDFVYIPPKGASVTEL